MVQRHPPTPPTAPAELQYDLQQLVQHNHNTPYKYDVDESQYAHSGAQSMYASPGHMQHHQSGGPYMSPQYGVSSYPEPHEQNDVGLGISMVRFLQRSTPLTPFQALDNVCSKKAPC